MRPESAFQCTDGHVELYTQVSSDVHSAIHSPPIGNAALPLLSIAHQAFARAYLSAPPSAPPSLAGAHHEWNRTYALVLASVELAAQKAHLPVLSHVVAA